ncbi:MAG: C1 family peptidase [Bacillota bacterium]
MLYVLVALIFSLQFYAQNGYSADCRTANSELRDINLSIAKSVRDKDVSSQISDARKLIKKCINLSEKNVNDDFYIRMLTATQQAEVHRRLAQIENYAQYGDVQNLVADLKNYMKSTRSAPLPNPGILNNFINVGRNSMAQERKSCTSVDLRPAMGPPRSQDSMGWCYAFTVADLVSYKLKQRVSAADIALSYNQDLLSDALRLFGTTEDKFSGGLITGAFKKSKKVGYCLEKDLPSEDNSGADLKTRLTAVDNMGRLAVQGEISCEQFYKNSKSMFPNAKFEDVRAILSQYSRDDYFKKLVDKTCKNRISGKNLEMSYMFNLNDSSFGKKIDAQLSAKNPVEFSYNSSILDDARTKDGFADHSSLIVGRRFNQKSGQCEYLVRNSWGKSCGFYDSNYSCENGNVWIPKATILKGARDATYLK